MKIYTYYQTLNDNYFQTDPKLIELWKISWSRQGYEPIVLNLEDAKKHPYFETLNSEMRRIFKEITNKEIEEYGMSCWFRWLAYATQTEEKFYVSDYDAINVNFPIKEPDDKLHLMDLDCPFFASGTPKQFEKLCKAFVEVSNERIDILKQQANHYHDQEFFRYNFNNFKKFNPDSDRYIREHDLLLTRDRRFIGNPFDPVTKKKAFDRPTKKDGEEVDNTQVFHISHSNCKWVLEKYPELRKEYSIPSIRLYMVKQLLGKID